MTRPVPGLHWFAQGPPIPQTPSPAPNTIFTISPAPHIAGMLFCRLCGALPGWPATPCEAWKWQITTVTETVVEETRAEDWG